MKMIDYHVIDSYLLSYIGCYTLSAVSCFTKSQKQKNILFYTNDTINKQNRFDFC